MNHIDTRKDNNGRGEPFSFAGSEVTQAELKSSGKPDFITSYPTWEGTKTEIVYCHASPTGEPVKETVGISKIVYGLIDRAVELIDEILDIYEDKIARDSTFVLVEEKINLLWENRERTNEHFKDVLVFLIVAAKNSYYQDYNKNQYETMKLVLNEIRKITITSSETKHCITLLEDSGIDLIAPLRNWEKYTVQIKKID